GRRDLRQFVAVELTGSGRRRACGQRDKQCGDLDTHRFHWASSGIGSIRMKTSSEGASHVIPRMSLTLCALRSSFVISITRGGMASEHEHPHNNSSELSEAQLRVRALEAILTEKGYVDPAALDCIVEAYEKRIGPHIGARVVARAWVDTEFRQRLLEDATKA